MRNFFETNAGTICSGGECDKKNTCKNAIDFVNHYGHRIYPVPAGEFCGYYEKSDLGDASPVMLPNNQPGD